MAIPFTNVMREATDLPPLPPNAFSIAFNYALRYIYLACCHFYKYKIPVGKLEEERLLLRPRRRWEVNIKMHINPLTPNDRYRGRTAPLTS